MKAQKMAFERKYADNSGIEFGVYYDADSATVKLAHVDLVTIPVSEIEWFIEALREVVYELPKSE